MASPVIAASSQGEQDGTDSISLVSGIAAGDTILIVLTYSDPGLAIGTPADFVLVNSQEAANNLVGYFTNTYAKKNAAGTETTATFTNLETAGTYHFVTARITGASTTTDPVGAGAQGSSGAPNPPNLAPAGGSADYLFIETGNCAFFNTPAQSTNYTDVQIVEFTGAGDWLAVASRALTASSDNPGTMSATIAFGGWSAQTIAIYPFVAPAGGQPKVKRLGGVPFASPNRGVW